MNKFEQKADSVKTVAPALATAKETEKSTIAEKTNKSTFEAKKEELKQILTPPSAEQRLKNLDHFKKLAEKHKFLANKHDELTAFRISKDGMREKIVMMSEDDTVLEINNPLIIDEVLNLCENKLSDLLKESENQILAFEI